MQTHTARAIFAAVKLTQALTTLSSAHHRTRNYLSRTNSPLQFASGSSWSQVKKVPQIKLFLQLATNLEDSGWSVSYFMLEIGSLGHFESNATRTLSDGFLLSKQEAKKVLMKLSRIAVSCSYHIFNTRLCSTWDVTNLYALNCFLFCLIVSFFFICYLHYFVALPSPSLLCVGILLS